ncbi:MAG: hypothetical protein Q8P67_25415 [archaeon]|nr:hypothetical protein [archaeon]
MASSSSGLEPTEGNLKQLYETLKATSNPAHVQKATETLKGLEKRPGYSLCLLRLSVLDKISPPERLMAAVQFKNFIKSYWDQDKTISGGDREQIRKMLPELLVGCHAKVQPTLSESLTIIAQQDFPENWPDLLPRLVEKLRTKDYDVINGVFDTLLSIFSRYSNHSKSQDDILRELKFVLDKVSVPLFEIFIRTTQSMLANSQDEGVLRSHFRALYTMSQVYYYLIFVDLPEYFEDNAGRIFEAFRKLLAFQTKVPFLLENEDDKEQPTVLYQLQGSICMSINIWIEKYEEEFKPFLQNFAELVWGILMRYDTRPRYDPVVTTALQFLTTTAKSIHYQVFSVGDILKNVCSNIICPHVMFRPIDKETFEENPFDYIRSDFEGSDAETRRRASSDFVRGLRHNYEKQITGFFAAHIKKMLAEYKADPVKNWRQKDAAIYLMIGLAVSAETMAGGVDQVNEHVPIMSFFRTEIAPELAGKKGHPVIQADAIKFAVQFRNQVSDDMLAPIFSHCAQYLMSPNVVVHSYAAIAVDKLLALVDAERKPRVAKSVYQPMVGHILSAIFKQLNTADSTENHYLMRALLRLARRCGADLLPQIPGILDALKAKLFQIAKNPSNPIFHLLLFETISCLIAGICAAEPSKVQAFEASLLGPFQDILQKDIDEFLPYVFQILGQMLLIGRGLRENYKKFFKNLLSPTLYSNKGNIPGLVALIQGYIRQEPPFVLPFLEGILGVFQKLISSRSLDHEGFYLMEAIVEYLPPRVLDPYIPTILKVLVGRLQLKASKTPKYVRCMIIFLSLMIAKQGGDFVVKHLDATIDRLTEKFLLSQWIPVVQTVSGRLERKICIIGMTKLLCDTPSFLKSYFGSWDKLLVATLKLIALPETVAPQFEDGDYTAETPQDYNSSFVRLSSIRPIPIDPFPEENPSNYFAINLSKLTAAHPGRFRGIKQLPSEATEVLKKILNAAGVSLSLD